MNYTKNNTNLAFTLVELIVVVTILAILATIGFVSYSSYLTGVRDTNRLAQLVSIHDGLELYRTTKDLPLPDESVDVIIGTETIATQGYAGSNVLETIDFTKGGVDPRDGEYFSYYLTDDRKYFQLMAFLEEETNITSSLRPSDTSLYEGGKISLLPKTQAVDYSSRIPTMYGKKLGILTNIANTPIQEIQAISDNGMLDISSSEDTSSYLAHLTDTSMIEGTATDSPLQYLDNIGIGGGVASSCKILIDRNSSLNSKDGIYVLDPEGGNPFPVYCDMTTDGGGWTLVMHGNDSDIASYDSRGDSSWSTGDTTIEFSGVDNTFKLDDNTLNTIRSGGSYRVNADSDIAEPGIYYFKSSCEYDHDLGINGDCSIMYTNSNFTTTRACTSSSGRRGLGCRSGVITNHTNALGNVVCYRDELNIGRCTGNTLNEGISLKVYVK